MENVVIFGTGDIAEIAYYYISKMAQYNVCAFTVDKDFLKTEIFNGIKVFAFENIEDVFPPDNYKMFIPISYNRVNQIRKQKYLEAKRKGYSFISYISEHSFVADNVKIGENCFIFEDNTIQPFVTIGNNCIFWSGNHIGHHSIIDDHCFISSHVVVSGGCKIGEGTFIGVNATLRDHIKIGKHNVIGAGAVILSDTDDYKVFPTKGTEPININSFDLKKI